MSASLMTRASHRILCTCDGAREHGTKNRNSESHHREARAARSAPQTGCTCDATMSQTGAWTTRSFGLAMRYPTRQHHIAAGSGAARAQSAKSRAQMAHLHSTKTSPLQTSSCPWEPLPPCSVPPWAPRPSTSPSAPPSGSSLVLPWRLQNTCLQHSRSLHPDR